MAWRARIWTGLAGAGVVLLTACSGSGGDQPAPSSLSGTPGGAPAGSTLPPASRVFDTTALQDGVRQVLTQSYEIADVTDVRCPSGQVVQVGISFDCEVTVGGVAKTVTLTVQTADGTYQVSQPK